MAGGNIGRFWPGSLGDYFLADSGLVYDSGTPGKIGPLAARFLPKCWLNATRNDLAR